MAKLFKPAPTQPAKMPVRNPILQDQEPEESFKPSRMHVASYKISGTEDPVSTSIGQAQRHGKRDVFAQEHGHFFACAGGNRARTAESSEGSQAVSAS